MAATNEVNFNELVDKDYIKGCLCYNQASLYNGDCGVESAANILRSDIGTWEVTSVPVEPIYKPYTAANDFDFMEGESMDEAIKRIVHEAVKELTKDGNVINVPEIEKYHIKHR